MPPEAGDFELLDHPADIGFRVRSATLPALFAACARALVAIILDPAAIEERETVFIPGSGADTESLLVNWLNEVLYFTDSRRLALGSFDIDSLTGTFIECTARGERRDPARHVSRITVKGVTYHQLKVQETAEGWLAEVFVDI